MNRTDHLHTIIVDKAHPARIAKAPGNGTRSKYGQALIFGGPSNNRSANGSARRRSSAVDETLTPLILTDTENGGTPPAPSLYRSLEDELDTGRHVSSSSGRDDITGNAATNPQDRGCQGYPDSGAEEYPEDCDDDEETYHKSTASHDELLAASKQEVEAVIVVSRTSAKATDEFVAKLHENNRRLYDHFQNVTHPSIHTCVRGRCTAEYKGIVFNGYSSNTNISRSKSRAMEELRQTLDNIRSDATHYRTSTAVIFSGEDGLFTNITGVLSFFKRYTSLNITLYMYAGDRDFRQFLLVEILDAIIDFKEHRFIENPCYRLVRDWTEVAVYKGVISNMTRGLRSLMPRPRNTIVETSLNETSQKIYYERSDTLPRYRLEVVAGEMCCPEENCGLLFPTQIDLVGHLIEKCVTASTCVLCPGNGPWTHHQRTHARKHIRIHIGLDLICPYEGCSFVTKSPGSLYNHKQSHVKADESIGFGVDSGLVAASTNILQPAESIMTISRDRTNTYSTMDLKAGDAQVAERLPTAFSLSKARDTLTADTPDSVGDVPTASSTAVGTSDNVEQASQSHTVPKTETHKSSRNWPPPVPIPNPMQLDRIKWEKIAEEWRKNPPPPGVFAP